MSITQQAIRARMAHRIDDEQADLIIDTDLLVTAQITCPVTGRVLDTRKAVLVKLPNGDHEAAVLDEATADDVAERFPGVTRRGPIPVQWYSSL